MKTKIVFRVTESALDIGTYKLTTFQVPVKDFEKYDDAEMFISQNEYKGEYQIQKIYIRE